MASLQFLVQVDNAVDPEGCTSHQWTAADIREQLPQFAALFAKGCDDACPSLTYYTDVLRYRISPLVDLYVRDQVAEEAAATP